MLNMLHYIKQKAVFSLQKWIWKRVVHMCPIDSCNFFSDAFIDFV